MEDNESHSVEHSFLYSFGYLVGHIGVLAMSPPDEDVGIF
jgi:hypothetical protein